MLLNSTSELFSLSFKLIFDTFFVSFEYCIPLFLFFISGSKETEVFRILNYFFQDTVIQIIFVISLEMFWEQPARQPGDLIP